MRLTYLVLIFAAAPPAYEEVMPAKTKEGVTARVQVDALKIPLSGSATVTLTVEGPAPLEVEPITAATLSKAWDAEPAGPPEIEPAGGRVRWRQSFRLEPRLNGDVIVPLAPLRYKAGKEARDWVEHRWKDVTIQVTTSVIDPKVKNVRGTSDIESLPDPPPWPRWPFALAGALVGVPLLLVVARRLRRRPPAAAADLPADRWALSRIDEIDRLDLAASGQVERFHRLLCDVLRAYLERRFQLPASQKTTEEFLSGLRESSPLPRPSQDLLRDFLQRCDLAKFARAEYSPEECRASSDLARNFVTQSAVAPAKPALAQ